MLLCSLSFLLSPAGLPCFMWCGGDPVAAVPCCCCCCCGGGGGGRITGLLLPSNGAVRWPHALEEGDECVVLLDDILPTYDPKKQREREEREREREGEMNGSGSLMTFTHAPSRFMRATH